MQTYKTFPCWKHQEDIVNHIDALDIEQYAFFLDCGTGKSKTVLEVLRDKAALLGRVPKTLIIGPTAVQENWKREIEMHTYFDLSTVTVIDGMTKANGKKLKTASKKRKIEQVEANNKNIFIITTATVGGMDVWDAITKLGIEFLIVDESHCFKDYKGKRSKALRKLSKSIKYKFILTGSPVLQDALDLWAQFYILNPKILGDNVFSFRAQYFYDTNAGMPSHVHFPNFIPKDTKYFNRMKAAGVSEKELNKQKMSNLNEIIYRHATRKMKREVLDLPDRTYQVLDVDMCTKQRKVYEAFRDDLVATIDGSVHEVLEEALDSDILDNIPEVMSADLAIVKTIRLMQLICGIFTNDTGAVELMPTNRIKILKETLQTLAANKENKIIIWTIFTPTYRQIAQVCGELNIKYTLLTGRQDKEEKQRGIDMFQMQKDIQVIIANPASGGTGVNLTAANYEIDYSRSFKLGDWLQKDSRADRGGQTRQTTSITLRTPNTIDAKIVEKLEEKARNAEDILAKRGISRGDILEMV